jgi:hypothetical protein
MKRNSHARYAQGQAAVELALALPFLLLCFLSIIYFGRVFFITEAVSYAAQEGSKVAAKLPELNNQSVRSIVTGFDHYGRGVYPNSVVYQALAGAHLLSEGQSGDLPQGAKVLLLPWDSDGLEYQAPPGTVSVFISYPFSLLGTPGGPKSTPLTIPISAVSGSSNSASTTNYVSFPDLSIQYQATAPQEVYQEGN